MDGARRLLPRADLRVGDTDRQAVVDELQRHYVEGRLDSDELGERVAQTLKAKTFGDLAGPLVDLPHLADNALAQAAPPEPHELERFNEGPPLAAVLMIVGAIALLAVFMLPGLHHFGMFPFWPILFWGFFFVGRPRHGGRRRW